MRHQSERVPGKNYRTFVDRPLFHHVVDTLLGVPSVTRILIDTDSPTIREQAADRFPSVEVVERPSRLLGGETPMTAVLQHDAGLVDNEWFLQTHSTNPLLRPETVMGAIEALFASDGKHDSLFSVTRLQTRLYGPDGRPLNHDPDVLLRTQDLPPVYEENSNIYVFPRERILEEGRRIGDAPLLYEIDRLEATDIDEESDFLMAEALYRIREGER
jgi:CMP-N-acetylneuraminic acid synthetase